MRISSPILYVSFLIYICSIQVNASAGTGAYVQKVVSTFVGLLTNDTKIIITSDGNIVVGCVEPSGVTLFGIVIKYTPNLDFVWKQRISYVLATGIIRFLIEDKGNGDIFFGISSGTFSAYGRINSEGKLLVKNTDSSALPVSDGIIVGNYLNTIGLTYSEAYLAIIQFNKNDLIYAGNADYSFTYNSGDYGVFLDYNSGTGVIHSFYLSSFDFLIAINSNDDPAPSLNDVTIFNIDAVSPELHIPGEYPWKSLPTPTADGFIVNLAGSLWYVDAAYNLKAKALFNTGIEPGVSDFDFFDINPSSTPKFKIAALINNELYSYTESSGIFSKTKFADMPRSTSRGLLDRIVITGSTMYGLIRTDPVSASPSGATPCVLAIGKFLINTPSVSLPCPAGQLNIRNAGCISKQTTSSCHKTCQSGKCYIINDPYSCADQCIGSGPYNDAFATCICPPEKVLNTITTPPICSDISKLYLVGGIYLTTCDYRCSGDCFGTYTYAECGSCNDMLFSESDGTLNGCKCKDTRTPDASNQGLCVYTSGCAPECKDKCIVKSDNTRCVAECFFTEVLPVKVFDAFPVVSCKCPAGRELSVDNKLCIYITGCDSKCDTKCFVQNDADACYDNCKTLDLIKTSTGVTHKVKCSCPISSSWDSATLLCIYSTGCHSDCGGQCTEQNKNDKCYKTCKSGITPSGSGNIVTCIGAGCGAGMEFANDGVTCIYNTLCSDLCKDGKCYVQNSADNCYIGCSSLTDMTVTIVSGNKVKCACISGKEFSNDNKICIFNTDCAINCGGKCFATLDPDQCFDSCKDASYTLTTTGTVHMVKCACPADSSYDSSLNFCVFSTGCDLRCGGKCAKKSDNTQCTKINACAAGMDPPAATTIYTCDCPSGKWFSVDNNLCVFITTCHPLCGQSKCFVQSSKDNCYDSCSAQSVAPVNTGTTHEVKCDCPSGASFISADCLCVFNSGCDSRCGTGCTKQGEGNNAFCYKDCQSVDLSLTGTQPIITCNCGIGMEYASAVPRCIYNTGCSTKCVGKCFTKNSDNECFDTCKDALMIPGVTGVAHKVICSCPPGMSWDNSWCYYSSGCDLRCGGKCRVQNSFTNCYESCSPGMITTGSSPSLTCDCQLGQWISSENLCLFNSGCSPFCLTWCFVPADKNKCYKICKEPDMKITPDGVTPYMILCDCPDTKPFFDTVSDSCIYTTGCSKKCSSYCKIPNSDDDCYLSCKNNAKKTATAVASIFKCSCELTQNWSDSNEVCYYSSGCDPRCGGDCTEQNNNAKCYLSCTSPFIQTLISGVILTCDCPSGGVYDSGLNKCVYSSNCHENCKSQCTAINSFIDCIDDCIDSMMDKALISTRVYSCNCKTDSVFDSTSKLCLYSSNCDLRCKVSGKCHIQSDNTNCFGSCANSMTMTATSNPNLFICNCPANRQWVTSYNICVLNTGCDPRCGDYKCLSLGDNKQCFLNCDAGMDKAIITLPQVKCDCPSGVTWIGSTLNRCIFLSGCDLRCGSDGCTKQAGDPTSNQECYKTCVSNAGITPVTINGDIVKCECPVNTIWDGTYKKCIFTSCDGRCNGKCTEQNNNYKCFGCYAANYYISGSEPEMTCDCPTGSSYDDTSYLCLYPNAQCSGMCATTCTVPNSASNCFQSCKSVDMDATPTSTPNVFACTCKSGMELATDNPICVYSSGCAVECGDKCSEKNSNLKCYKTCAPTTTKIGSGPIFECKCPNDQIYLTDIKQCVYNTGCSDKCNGKCINKNDESSCYTDCSSTYLVKTKVSDYVYSCTCPTDTTWDSTYKICYYSNGCDIRCQSTCITKDDPTKCYGGCGLNAEQGSITTPSIYECKCKTGTVYESAPKKCAFNTGCHEYCKITCIAQSDNTNCVDCSDPFMVKTSGTIPGIFSCECPSGKTFDSASKMCIFNSGCDPRCNGNCGVQNDNTKCILSCGADASIESGAVATPYIKCVCNSDFDFLNNKCIRKSGCHWKCGGHCTAPSDNTKCYESCKKATYTKTPQGTDNYKCDCPSEAFLEDPAIGECIYSTGCSNTCFDKCIEKDNNEACYLDCKGIAAKTPISTNIFKCTCPADETYDNNLNKCVYYVGCDDACMNTCLEKNNNKVCVGGCASSPDLIKTAVSSNIFSCVCPDGSPYNKAEGGCLFFDGCDYRCGPSCVARNSKYKCNKSCRTKDMILTPVSGDVVTCDCSLDSIYDSNAKVCLYSAGCHRACKDKCSTQNSNLHCYLECQPNLIKDLSLSPSVFSCSCPSGMEFAPASPICVFSSGCHPFCGKLCLTKNDNTACYSECRTSYYKATKVKDYITKCECPQEGVFNQETGSCVFSSNCHITCNGKCLLKGDENSCFEGCNKGLKAIKQINGTVRCQCEDETMKYLPAIQSNLTASLCVYDKDCHPLCGKYCLKLYDFEACYFDCASWATNLSSPVLNNSEVPPNTICSCPLNTTYSSKMERCVYNVGCHPLCKSGQCASIDNPKECIGECVFEAEAKINPENNQLIACKCKSGTMFVGGLCKQIINQDCHAMCSKEGCLYPDNAWACLGCIKGPDIIATKSKLASVDSPITTCSCASKDQDFSNDRCVYIAGGCHPNCIRCFKKSSAIHCETCAKGINGTKVNINGSTSMNCSCPAGYSYNGVGCVKPVTLTCHYLCNGSCLEPNNQSRCLSYRNISNGEIILNPDGLSYTCRCKTNYTFNPVSNACELSVVTCTSSFCAKCSLADPDMCYDCVSGVEGLVMTGNRCGCNSQADYIQIPGPSCQKIAAAIETATTTTTSSVASICIVSTIFITQQGSFIWLMIFAEQELALMSLVRIKDLAPGIVLFFRAISLFSGNFLPNAFSFILPNYITGAEAEYNLLPEWSDLNPAIAGKLFLISIGKIFTQFVLTGVIVGLVLLLGLKIDFFRKFSKGMGQKVLLRSFITNFIPVSLSAFIQLKYSVPSHGTFWIISSVAAGLAVALEAGLIIISIMILSKPTDDLKNEDTKTKYGCLYECVLFEKPQIYNIVFKQVKTYLLIIVIIFASDYPIIQSSAICVSLISGVIWNLRVKPADDKLKQWHGYISSTLMALAGISFVILSIDNIPANLRFWAMNGELLFLLGTTLFALSTAILEQIRAVYMKIKECRQKKRADQYQETSSPNAKTEIHLKESNTSEFSRIDVLPKEATNTNINRIEVQPRDSKPSLQMSQDMADQSNI